MAVSKHRPKHKAKKKASNIQKTKQKQMDNASKQKAEQNPISFQFHKDATHVSVPINAWKTVIQCARVLEPLAMLISVLEQIGKDQIDAGELLPVFLEDTEEIPGAKPNPDGTVQRKIKDSFWNRKDKSSESLIQTFEKPSIVMADGKTVYDASQVTQPASPVEPKG